jgi:hypothetical protein
MQAEATDSGRVVIWLPNRDAGWAMPAAEPYDNGWVEGGRRTMHELAAAIACTGRRVEFRGEMSLPVLEEVSTAAGVRVELPGDPRHPSASDTVIVNEGVADPRVYARLALSPARTVLLVLGPLGMFGWPFVETPWTKPDHETMDLSSLSRPEHFAGAAALGFEMWSHTPAFARVAEAAGLRCALVGRGRPAPFPAPAAERDIDVLMLERSHWPRSSRRIAKDLDAAGLHVVTLPVSGHARVLESLGRARVLVHPARAEASPRIGSEARAMGAVPVVLGTNPFGSGMDEAHGIVTVDAVDEVSAAVADLLADPRRLELLSARGIETARRETAWEPYVERVREALDAAPAPAAADPGRAARAGLGAALRAEEGPLEDELAAVRADLAAVRADLARHREWLEATNASLSWRATAPLRAVRRRLGGR